MIRQGDVLVIPIEKIPDGAKKLKREKGRRVVLAAGEVTGHHHAIADRVAALFEAPDGERYLQATGSCTLSHEEHDAHEIGAGSHRVVIQCEYVEGEVLRVED